MADRDGADDFRMRRAPRSAVASSTGLRPQSCYEVEVEVQNVSTCGFMAECQQPVAIGSYVILDVPGLGQVRAQVRWQIGGRIGGMFLHPISLSQSKWSATPVADDAAPEAGFSY